MRFRSSRRPRAVLVLGAVWLVAGSLGCGQTAAHSTLPRGTLFLGSSRVPLRVEVAETEASKERGLMNRTTLAEDAGMVFPFDGPTTATFYMKDTLIPLSIAFWDGTRRIVAILDMEPCPADPCQNYSAGVPFVAAVEANRGFFAEHGIGIGDTVELER
jgi:uncharacterized membrane protein (UPF0127 family)